MTLAAIISGDSVPDIRDVLDALEDSEASVMVAVIIHNHSGHKMMLEEVDISCGTVSNNSRLPEYLDPDGSYVIYTETVKIIVLCTKIIKVFSKTDKE